MPDANQQNSTDRPGVSSAWRTLAIVLGVVLLIGGVGLVLWQVSSNGETSDLSSGETSDFPTGTFTNATTGDTVVFNEDGTCLWYAGGQIHCTYAVNGDLYTEMTFVWQDGVQVPATYYWAYDGEKLTFELWGEDLRPHRRQVYGRTYTHVTAE